MSSATLSPFPRASHEEHLHTSSHIISDPLALSNSSSSRKTTPRTLEVTQEQSPAATTTRSRSGSKPKFRSKTRPDVLSSMPKRNNRPAFLAVYGAASEREGQGSSSYSSSYSSSTDTATTPLPPPSPQLPYFDKYPRRSERLKPLQTIGDDRDDSTVSPRSRGPLIPQRPASAPGPRSSSEPRFGRGRPNELEKPKDPEGDGTVYAWPAKPLGSGRPRRPPGPSSTKTRTVSRPSPSSSTSSSPSSSPKLPPPRPLPPLIPNSPYGRFGSSKFPLNNTLGRDNFAPPRSVSPEDPLAVTSGFDVSNMDALVEQMNSARRESVDMSVFAASQWTFAKAEKSEMSPHPLHHPPLPPLPQEAKSSNSRVGTPQRRPSTTESYPEPARTAGNHYRSNTVESIRPVHPSHSSSSSPSLSRSSGVSDLSSISAPRTESSTYDHNPIAGDNGKGQKGSSHNQESPAPLKIVVPSISDIIRAHAPELKVRLSHPRSFMKTTPSAVPELDEEADHVDSRSSMDSVAEEALRTATTTNPKTLALHHAKSVPNRMSFATPSRAPSTASPRSPSFADSSINDIYPFNPSEISVASSTASPHPPNPRESRPPSPTQEMAQYLRSPRLTRLITLRKHANCGVTVSIADVGLPTGHPVMLFLGLGCVRYIIGLYDEMAEALNLRLVCIDRWGLGRTTDVPSDKRGMLEWASVVEEVADQLGLQKFGIIAHSAGAPYSLATALRMGDRITGSIHLLAPWVSMSVDGGYKWLKYIPAGLIKTAQTAEWKVQGWKLGKPPTITYEGIGFDPNVSVSSSNSLAPSSARESNESRPSFSASEYDDLADFNGRFASTATLNTIPDSTPPPEPEVKKKASIGSFLGFFEGRPRRQPSLSSRPTSQRAESLPVIPPTRSSISGDGRSLQRKKSKTSVKSLKAASLSSKDDRKPLSLPPLPTSEEIPHLTLGFDFPQFDQVSDWGTTVRAKTMYHPSPESAVTGRSAGQRSLSLLPSSGSTKKDVSTPPLPPLPPFALNLDLTPPSPTGSYGTTYSQLTGSVNSRSTVAGSNTATAASAKRSQKPGGITLASALMSASHAEALKGGTADLLSILERGDSRPWGFSYTDIKHPVKIWYGDRDDRIGIGSIRWMERAMRDCTIKIIKGQGHGLLTNADVVVDVLESIAKEARARGTS